MIPSIDILGGRAVQLVNGRGPAMDCGAPLELAERFSILGELAVVDLDAAMGRGDNRTLVKELAGRWPCRVGGGLRSRDEVTAMLDAGAAAVMVGTMASPGFLSAFPRERVMAALDCRGDRVMVKGWEEASGAGVGERLRELAPVVGGFLLTDIGREGTMGGLDLDRVAVLSALARDAGFRGRLVFAGGAASPAEIAAADALGADVQAGMALYRGRLDPAEALAACLRSDREDGLWPTLVCDERGTALGLAWSDRESLSAAMAERRGIYRSRTRGLWRKGESSGALQRLLRVDADCDRDCLRFTVRQEGGGFCHEGTRGCFSRGMSGSSDPAAGGLPALARLLEKRLGGDAPAGSYTARLFADPALLGAKLREEADELARAEGPERAAEEAADLAYFMLTALFAKGSCLAGLERVLDRRSLVLSRRPGDAKPAFMAEAVR